MADTMLIVDDEPLVLGVVGDMLESEGYEVLRAKDADHALTIAQDHHENISLLLTDINMPKMSGLELAERLTHRHPDLRLVVMSGRQHLNDNELPDNGTFLPKPFTYRQLMKVVTYQLSLK